MFVLAGRERRARARADLSSSEYCTCMLTSGDAGGDQLGRVRRIEIGAAEPVDLALALQLVEPARGLD